LRPLINAPDDIPEHIEAKPEAISISARVYAIELKSSKHQQQLLFSSFSLFFDDAMMKAVYVSFLLLIISSALAFRQPNQLRAVARIQFSNTFQSKTITTVLRASEPNKNPASDSVDETTEKYGLEAGLYKAITTKDEEGAPKVRPQDLLKKYGIAYLVTSITLAIISYAICFALVSNGVDVSSMLEKFGLEATSAGANAGTAAIAYAIHKGLSPVRFPPTVALTPIVANLLGKKPNEEAAK
jgi:hypothetical protein